MIEIPKYTPAKIRAVRARLKLKPKPFADLIGFRRESIYRLEARGTKIRRTVSLAVWLIDRRDGDLSGIDRGQLATPAAVRELRERMRWSKKDLAEALGIGERQIYRLETPYPIHRKMWLALTALAILAEEGSRNKKIEKK